ncbi:MAG: glycerophosphodiester phosphodiesterase family protein [Xanthobacteraceae bacterium]|nr:glycerophosphodiester phosphodiesterase family protein [Xanthobacteraceae bacterium]
MRAPAWLTARPIAHRGLHDRARGIIENTASAAAAAAAAGFGIEVDLQLSADGEAMVHHDDELGRLTQGRGRLIDLTAIQLRNVAFRDTADRLMTLSDLCALVAGRVPLVLEVKSQFSGDRRLVARMAQVLAAYDGPAAAMSFDPDQVLALRELLPERPRGIVAQRSYDDGEWVALPEAQRRGMLHLRHGLWTRPHFVAYWIEQLPSPAPWLARHLFGCALLTWTVRTSEQRARAAQWADQMIFEGFVP